MTALPQKRAKRAPNRSAPAAPVQVTEPPVLGVDAVAPWGPRAGVMRELQPRTLASKTAQQLRRDIIRNRFQPGERLTIEKLASLYDAGTSPLREALFQVSSDGLVRMEDHKGFIVAPLSFGEMFDVSSLRAYLEVDAIRRSIENGGEKWETDVLAAEHRLTRAERRLLDAGGADARDAEDEWELRHREFHYALCSACGSPWLLYFFDALYDQLERYRRYFWRYQERARDADDQHEQIKDAALARDADRAVALLNEHFRRQAELTLRQTTVEPPDGSTDGSSKPRKSARTPKVNGQSSR